MPEFDAGSRASSTHVPPPGSHGQSPRGLNNQLAPLVPTPAAASTVSVEPSTTADPEG
jgi:hypothetical protein